MTHIGECCICSASTIDSVLCIDCMQFLSLEALKSCDKEAVKKEVEKRRMEFMQKELAEERERLSKICPTCGKSGFSMKGVSMKGLKKLESLEYHKTCKKVEEAEATADD